jgi:hypothetical protein
MAMLKVALMGVLMATFVAPFAGMVDTTEGTVTVSWPQPAIKTTSKAANEYVIPNLILRICPSHPTVGVPVSNSSLCFSRPGAPGRHDEAKVIIEKLPGLSENAHIGRESFSGYPKFLTYEFRAKRYKFLTYE